MSATSGNAEKRSSKTNCQFYSKLPRAHYLVAGLSVDVTDLLNNDFDLVGLVEQVLVHLAVHTECTPEELLSYAEQALTAILDLQTDRVLELIHRFTDHQHRLAQEDCIHATQRAQSEVDGLTSPLAERCVAFNGLGSRAQASDFANLKAGGRDMYSKMKADELMAVIGEERWVKMHARLRAERLLTPRMEVKVARWIARGLDVRLAVEKVKFDSRLRRLDT